VDTDVSPYDSGSYASSTTYLTGRATVEACQELRKKMIGHAAELLESEPDQIDFDGKSFYQINGEKTLSLEDLGNLGQGCWNDPLTASAQRSSEKSPPPYMVGMAEIELDMETGKVELIEFDAVVDCGTPINPNLARIQTEGGLVQGIGMTMYENVLYDDKGRCLSNSFMQYKIPTRLDMGNIRVEFESSYEPDGPFGAKSIGEIVINTPSGAITDAVYNATGVRIRELPVTSEKIFMGMKENTKEKM
jgi:CO/xanthine dehydrogenase Mo-binding subunit